jgi:succinate-semialdehyde dehydrogenase / glutarate-semialdehyde dehydrogenase
MTSFTYPNTLLLIDGVWRPASTGRTEPVLNPATGQVIGTHAHASLEDLEDSAVAVKKGFDAWRRISAFDRYKVMRKAANLLRDRAEAIAPLMTMEQGKVLAEARAEILAGADTIDWFAEEGRRAYGRIVPSRTEGVHQLVVKEPVGPVAAFTPWNFPVNQIVRKLAAALAAGCSIVVKAPEETPASPAELLRVFVDAGVPAGTVNLVLGDPTEISAFFIEHPVIRKISFTGSTAIGKQLASLAGLHMKRTTMELGGHAPVVIFDDADIAMAANVMSAAKFRNAGQVCISPTRFLVQEAVFEEFVERFVAATRSIVTGDGLDSKNQMGALANPRRTIAMELAVEDSIRHGGKVRTGGERIGSSGNFFAPTVVTEVDRIAHAMNVEPFGPLALINPFRAFDDAVAEANRLPFGLASYAWSRSAKTVSAIGCALEAGMVSINHVGLGFPEVPFGGVKDSGHGSEGGTEAIEPYMNPKFITQAGT